MSSVATSLGRWTSYSASRMARETSSKTVSGRVMTTATFGLTEALAVGAVPDFGLVSDAIFEPTTPALGCCSDPTTDRKTEEARLLE